MTDKIEYKGKWFLPDKPDFNIAGVLTYIPHESIVLELIGGFSDDFEEIISGINEAKIIYGSTSDANKITLFNCFPSTSRNFSSTFSITRYSCHYLIIGKHLHSFNDPSFYEARVYFNELTYWCLPDSLQGKMQIDENGVLKMLNISFVNFNENNEDAINNTQIDDNTNLLLKKCVDYSSSNFFLTPKIEQYTCLEIHKLNDSSIDDFLSNIFLYEQFLSIATLEVVVCSKIFLYDRNLFHEANGSKRFDKIELIYIQRDNGNKYKPTKRDNYLFLYDTIKNQYDGIIKKWFAEKGGIAPIRIHLIESIKPTRIFTSIDFLIVIQALDGFCLRFRKDELKKIAKDKPQNKQASLGDMICLLKSEFSTISKIKNDDIVIQQVVDSRHYYSHFMDRSKKKDSLDGVELYKLTHKLRKLLICCLLHFIGFDYNQIDDIFKKCYNNLIE
ncbi:MAG: hypothetical protein PHT65_10320 [Proteiniphilum sp.]|nr:hypothetical protein [Proteiniphilum sp.]